MKKWFVLAMLVCVAAAVQAADGAGEEASAAKAKKPDMTKEQFIASQKKTAEKKGEEFDQAKAEATFTKLDVNKDGKLSADEQAKGKKAKPKKTSDEEGESDSEG